MKPNRVLLTGDTAGGVWTFSTQLAKSLSRSGLQVMLATFGPSVSEVQRKQAGSIAGIEWRHHFAKLEWMNDPWDDLRRSGRWLTRLISEFQPELLHLNTFCHSEKQSNVPTVLTAHSCVAAWWSAIKKSPLPAVWARYQSYVEHSLGLATILTTPTRAALHETAAHFDVDTSRALPIYNGSDPRIFKPGQKEPIVLSVGRLWDEAKNGRALADVSSAIRWPIYLAGSTVSPSRSEATFAHCHLLGELPSSQLYSWYSRASIYALPAKYEPFGLSALEAALSGCALVLGDIPSLREIWCDAAVFVDPDDPSELTAALKRLIKDQEYTAAMAQRALQRGREFTLSRMSSAYRQAYTLAAERHREPTRRHACAS